MAAINPTPSLVEQYPDLPVVSYSQVSTFDRCELAWDLSYRRGWKTTRQFQKMELGTMVGKILNVLYETHDEEAIVPLVNEWLSGPTDGFILPNIATATWLAKRYFHDVMSTQAFKVLGTERHFMVLLTTPLGRQFILQGYIDLLVENVDGTIWIWEHKTTGRFWTPIQTLMAPQLPTYAAGLRALGIDVVGIVVNMLNNYDYKNKEAVTPDKLFKQIETYRTPVELDNFLINLGRKVDRMIDLGPYPERSLRNECDRCQFQEPCLMEMKGLDIEDVLRVGFRQKSGFGAEQPTTPTNIYLEF
jgi:hypothetical protein